MNETQKVELTKQQIRAVIQMINVTNVRGDSIEVILDLKNKFKEVLKKCSTPSNSQSQQTPQDLVPPDKQ